MLTDKAIKNAKPRAGKPRAGEPHPPAQPSKIADREALYLYVSGKGAKSFRYDYRIAGRRKTHCYGLYPDMSLARARELHADARRLVAAGIDPAGEKKKKQREAASASANTVRAVAEEWRKRFVPHRSRSWSAGTRRWLDQHVYPAFGDKAVRDVTPHDVLELVEEIAKKHARTAGYIRQMLSRIFMYAISKQLCTMDPAHSVRGALIMPPVKHHRPVRDSAITGLAAKIRAYEGRRQTVIAAELLLLTCVRKRELIEAEVSELNFDTGEWRIPARRMKGKRDHIVPLSTQALALFKEAITINFDSRFVFPNLGEINKPMSHSTLNPMLKSCAAMTPHAMRATFDTAANESNRFRPDVIERVLAHVERNKVRSAYNAAEYLPERRELLQWWADHCTGATNVSSLEAERRRRMRSSAGLRFLLK